jgi:hypothetical protein
MPKFETKDKELYIDNKKVIKGWESFTGWYWFATEEAYKQDSILPNGKEIPNDTIYFSKGELESLKPKIWEIPTKALYYSGRRK